MLASIFLPFLLLFQTPVLTPRPVETPPQAKPAATPEQKDEPPVVTKHSIQVGGRAPACAQGEH